MNIVITALLFGSLQLLAAPAVNSASAAYIGLWEGVDSVDGSSIALSITADPVAADTFNLLWRESYFWRCEKRGIGVIRGDAYLATPDGPLEIYAELFCLDQSKGGTLVRPVLFLNADGSVLASDNGSLILHRTSSH